MFYDCSSMTAVNVASDNTHYASEFGVLYDKAKTTLLYCPGAKTGGIVIPDSVTTIEESALRKCTNLNWVVFGSNVEIICATAFLGCNHLSDVRLNNKLQTIGYAAFSQTSLTSITIPDSVVMIEALAFFGSLLTSVTIGRGVEYLGSSAFSYCLQLERVTFLGSPPDEDSFDANTFLEVASNFCIYYTASHASEWAPHGETTWQGFPIRMIPDPLPVLPGDADGSGTVNANDALAVMRYALGLIPSVDLAASDVNCDGVVNANDALMIMRAALGLITL